MTTTQNTITTVGEFTFDSATSEIQGPASFMASADFADWKRRFHAGQDVVFAAGMEHSPTPEVAMLVSIQTCFAGWHGRETFNRSRGL
jgi:hypothetical protein